MRANLDVARLFEADVYSKELIYDCALWVLIPVPLHDYHRLLVTHMETEKELDVANAYGR